MELILKILKGVVIGLANIIPGVSGGTMMVSMGIYDTLIYCINHLFKEFKQCIKTLLPYVIGILAAFVVGAFGLKAAFRSFPMPTNALFIGLILGSIPMILKEMKGTKKGVPGVVLFIAFFALVVGLKLVEAENTASIQLSVWMIIKLVLLGMLASSTMVIPGVSGSMLLKTLGYYEPIMTVAIPDLITALTHGDGAAILHNVGILLPYGIGIVCGIIAIAQLIALLLKKWKGITYCAIMGMVLASPVVILMGKELYVDVSVGIIIASVVCLALGAVIALKLGGESETPAGK